MGRPLSSEKKSPIPNEIQCWSIVFFLNNIWNRCGGVRQKHVRQANQVIIYENGKIFLSIIEYSSLSLNVMNIHSCYPLQTTSDYGCMVSTLILWKENEKKLKKMILPSPFSLSELETGVFAHFLRCDLLHAKMKHCPEI